MNKLISTNKFNSKILFLAQRSCFTNHVFPTSVICETLFSYGKNVMTPQRRHMDPSTFEMFMLLRTNSDLYNALTLDIVRERFKLEAEQRKRARETETELTTRLTNFEHEIDQDDA